MTSTISLALILEKKKGVYVAWIPQLGLATQAGNIGEAIANAKEACELHLSCLTPVEQAKIIQSEGKNIFITTMECKIKKKNRRKKRI